MNLRSFPQASMALRSPRARCAGFSLIELMTVAAIVVLLVAAIAPALSTSLRTGRDSVRTLNDLRQHALTCSAYAADWYGSFPYFVDPKSPSGLTDLRCAGTGFTWRTNYFGAPYSWNVALADGYYDGNHMHPSFYSPMHGDWGNVLSSYYYSASFLADPRYWNRATRTGPRQWRAIRAHEVRFPSQKGALKAGVGLPLWPAASGPYSRLPIAFVDGSGRDVQAQDLRAWYLEGDGTWPGSLHTAGTPVLHTLDGVHGRDVN